MDVCEIDFPELCPFCKQETTYQRWERHRDFECATLPPLPTDEELGRMIDTHERYSDLYEERVRVLDGVR